MANSHDDTRRKGGQGIHDPDRAIEFEANFSLIQDVRTRDIKYSFLPMRVENREHNHKQRQELE